MLLLGRHIVEAGMEKLLVPWMKCTGDECFPLVLVELAEPALRRTLIRLRVCCYFDAYSCLVDYVGLEFGLEYLEILRQDAGKPVGLPTSVVMYMVLVVDCLPLLDPYLMWC